MKWPARMTGLVLLMTAATAGAQSLTFYESPSFGGRSFSSGGTIANFERFGFNDRASSVVIRSGRWQFCTDANFQGNCVTLRPGSYPDLRAMGLNNRVSSARVYGGGPPPGAGYRPPPPPRPPAYRPPPSPGHSSASVVLFDGYGLSGERFRVSSNMFNLDNTGWNDRARSLIVRHGRWQLCNDAGFHSYCQVFGPGRYDNIGPLAGNLSSLRQVR